MQAVLDGIIMSGLVQLSQLMANDGEVEEGEFSEKINKPRIKGKKN